MKARQREKQAFNFFTPACVGYYVLTPQYEDNGRAESIDQMPVIWWAREGESTVPYAVTLEGVVTHDAVILRPDGAVDFQSGRGFPSVDAWLNELQEEFDKNKAKENHGR